MAGHVDLALLISANKKICLYQTGGINYVFLSSKEAVRYEVKSHHVIGTFNQILSTDEIMPDLNCSCIYNMQNSQLTYARESMFESRGARMSDSKQSQQRVR